MKVRLDVKCRLCKAPGQLETDNSVPIMESLIFAYTCDNCMIRTGRMKAKQHDLIPPALPFKDD